MRGAAHERAPMSHAHRGTIFLEQARVISQLAYDGEQFVLRVAAPKCAAHAGPGSFAHLTCDAAIPMRRPLSIMRADARAGWIEMLYKVEGRGLHALAARKAGDTVSVLGPIGRPFEPHPERPRTLLIGGGVGIPPMVVLAERLHQATGVAGAAAAWKPLVLMGSEIPFPFRPRPSTLIVPGIPDGTIAAMPLLDEWGVPSRLASNAGFAGCYGGHVSELAARWLAQLAPAELAEVAVYACGPEPMLAATARLARSLALPCQLALEEFMACAVGGCAGCAVEIRSGQGRTMQRVCVDGPVFDAQAVYPQDPPAGI